MPNFKSIAATLWMLEQKPRFSDRKSALPRCAVVCHVRCSDRIFKFKPSTCRWDQYLQNEGSNLKIAWKLSFFYSYSLYTGLVRIYLLCGYIDVTFWSQRDQLRQFDVKYRSEFDQPRHNSVLLWSGLSQLLRQFGVKFRSENDQPRHNPVLLWPGMS